MNFILIFLLFVGIGLFYRGVMGNGPILSYVAYSGVFTLLLYTASKFTGYGNNRHRQVAETIRPIDIELGFDDYLGALQRSVRVLNEHLETVRDEFNVMPVGIPEGLEDTRMTLWVMENHIMELGNRGLVDNDTLERIIEPLRIVHHTPVHFVREPPAIGFLDIINAIARRTRRETGNDQFVPTTEQLLQSMVKVDEVTVDSNDVCGVCYINFEGKDELLCCPHCMKSTHSDCIKEWFESGQKICVYCRREFLTKRPKDLEEERNEVTVQ